MAEVFAQGAGGEVEVGVSVGECLFHHAAFDRFAAMAYIHGIYTASWPWLADEASPPTTHTSP
jgi:hypothetical protein